ncbi:MAG: hypothetical protein LBJ11_06640 [Oscillospiraceae bacterium]|jgi:hypothetical protein|nr:hypothetical protein [Oscillospiraceae bacterium]
MKKQKFYVTEDKWLILVHALNDFRNKRIAEGKCIDTVNDTLFAVMNAKTKRVRIAG